VPTALDPKLDLRLQTSKPYFVNPKRRAPNSEPRNSPSLSLKSHTPNLDLKPWTRAGSSTL